jgi:tetratricopeptide (TPR) repeat protein
MYKFYSILAVWMTLVVQGHAADKFIPSEVYKEAERLREEGQTLNGLNLFNIAIVEYQKQGNYIGVIKSIEGRFICWHNLFVRTKDKIYAIFAKNDADAMMEIAEEHKIFELDYQLHYYKGKTNTFLKNYYAAENEFRIAIETYPEDNSEKGDRVAYWGYVTYLTGNKEKGKQLLLDGIKQIEQHAEKADSFLVHIWLSGAYLRLAEILRTDNNQEGRYYLDKAQQIINSDPRLVNRKDQLKKVEKEYEK